jgi:hypothetical protein
MITTFFYLLIGHAVADYALQSPWMAKAKNRHSGPPESYDPAMHGKIQPIWPMVMAAHALIHAGAVVVITGDPFLGVWQFLAHYMIDTLKCDKMFNVWVDQSLHVFVLAMTAIYVGMP